jgi:hypothetical protein
MTHRGLSPSPIVASRALQRGIPVIRILPSSVGHRFTASRRRSRRVVQSAPVNRLHRHPTGSCRVMPSLPGRSSLNAHGQGLRSRVDYEFGLGIKMPRLNKRRIDFPHRERAGRSLVHPGGPLNLTRPSRPFERWPAMSPKVSWQRNRSDILLEREYTISRKLQGAR